MRIGIDAKWYFDGPPSGRRVIRGLVDSMAGALTPDDEVHLFLNAKAGDLRPLGFAAENCHPVWGGVNQLSNLTLVRRAADRLRLDAVVYQNFAPAASMARHATIAFVHDVIFAESPEFFTPTERLYFAPLRALSRRADRVCTVSESEKARMVRLGFAAKERIDVVPNAVDTVFRPLEALSHEDVAGILRELHLAAPYVLSVGRLTARKNVIALVRAMSMVSTAELRLVVVGGADSTCPDLQAEAARAGVAERVQFLGPRGDESLPALLASASLFCFPSLDESFGIPPLEAMAAGTPVVASNRPAIVETCADAAVYVDPTDPRAIAAAIDALMADPPRRARLKAAGLERARAFTWHRSAQRLLNCVRTAVAMRQ